MENTGETDWTKRLDEARMLTIEEMAVIFHRPVDRIRRQLGRGDFEIAPRVSGKRITTLWSPLDVKHYLATPPPKRGGAR